jgi:hypothetical protein
MWYKIGQKERDGEPTAPQIAIRRPTLTQISVTHFFPSASPRACLTDSMSAYLATSTKLCTLLQSATYDRQ